MRLKFEQLSRNSGNVSIVYTSPHDYTRQKLPEFMTHFHFLLVDEHHELSRWRNLFRSFWI